MIFDANQKTAIETIDNPLMIVSTAGSGKTSVIVARANQIVKSGVKPYRILVVTFSKMAALEMQQRYAQWYGEAGIRFSTIHSLCYSVLARAFSITADSIVKESDKRLFFTNMHRKLLYQKISGTPADFEELKTYQTSYIFHKRAGNNIDNLSIFVDNSLSVVESIPRVNIEKLTPQLPNVAKEDATAKYSMASLIYQIDSILPCLILGLKYRLEEKEQ